MDSATLQTFLGWCALINTGLLLGWWFFIWFAHDFVFRTHTRWFPMSRERFDAIHYTGIMILKLLVFVFVLVPYLALRIMSG